MLVRRLVRFTGFLLFLTLLLFGALVASTPFLEQLLQKSIPRIEIAATRFFGSQVHFKKVEARLHWVLPEFDLVDLTVGPRFSVQKLTLQLNVAQSFFSRSPKFGKISLSGAVLKLEE